MSEAYRGSGEQPSCMRCNVALTPVNVLDHGHARVYVGLVYTTDAMPEKSLWSGAVTNATGVIRAHVCPRCRMVAWYAHPGDAVVA